MFSKYFIPSVFKSNPVPENLIDEGHMEENGNLNIDASLFSNSAEDNLVISELYNIVANLPSIHFLNLGTVKDEFKVLGPVISNQLDMLNCRQIIVGEELKFNTKINKSVVCSNKINLVDPVNSEIRIYAGIQRHICPPSDEKELLNSTVLGLGSILGKINILEPYIRDAELLTIDLNVIKSTELNIESSYPVGLSIMDVCQIAKYAGLASSNKYLNIVAPEISNSIQAKTIALIIWYYLEGLSLSKIDKLDVTNSTSYVINSKHLDLDLEFRKNNLSNRWWLKNPTDSDKYIPCLYEDYLAVCNEDTSDRILDILERV